MGLPESVVLPNVHATIESDTFDGASAPHASQFGPLAFRSTRQRRQQWQQQHRQAQSLDTIRLSLVLFAGTRHPLSDFNVDKMCICCVHTIYGTYHVVAN